MSEIKNSFLDLVGQTPLVRVNNLIKKNVNEYDNKKRTNSVGP